MVTAKNKISSQKVSFRRFSKNIIEPKQQFIFRVLPKVPFFIWILGCRFRHWIIHNCLLLFKDMLLTWHLFQGIFNWKYDIQIQLKLVNLVHSKILISGTLILLVSLAPRILNLERALEMSAIFWDSESEITLLIHYFFAKTSYKRK